MKHFLGEMTDRTVRSTNYRARASCEGSQNLHGRRTPGLMLILHIVGVAALVVASVAAIADQSARFVSGQEIVGVHEIPAFIAGRVELTPGLTPDGSALDVGGDPGGRGGEAGLSPHHRTAEQG
ncbi:MAG TPA: hypothetical protein VML91_28995 [Burkholderiales bacterium]|nr:hypothetical protein [Burkholderiales bacterium]